MKVGTQTLLPTGNFLNKRYSLEIDFPDGSSIPDAFEFLNNAIIATHMREFPMFYKDGKPLYQQYTGEDQEIPVQTQRGKVEENIKFGISSCTEVTVLESYYMLAKKNPELLKLYENKLKQLKK